MSSLLNFSNTYPSLRGEVVLRALCSCLLILVAFGCGRYFPGPLQPKPGSEQGEHMVVHDDGSVAYVFERLDIAIRPMKDAELNRSFATRSADGPLSTNPFTFGDWTPPGESFTPQRFTVFLLRVKNYAYPKVKIDPSRIELRSASERSYKPLTFLEISEYYRAYALAWAGNYYARMREREDLLRLHMYADKMIFSGQEHEGFIVFPPMPPDVTELAVHVNDVAVRFNYADEPVETVSLTYGFQREVFRGYQPPATVSAR